MSLVVKLVLFFGLLYVGLTVAAWLLQSRLMYFPDIVRTHPSVFGLDGVEEITFKTPDDAEIISWWARAKPGKPTLLYFHGNAGTLVTRGERIRKYQAHGYGVFMMTYRGFGGSTGQPSEQANVADAKQAYELLISNGVDARNIVLYGESLGTGVATQVAADKPITGLILDAPYTSMIAVAEVHYPYLPARWFMTDRYLTLNYIARIDAPLLIVHGEADQIIPVSMAHAVFAAAREPKKLATFPGAGHADHDAFGSYEKIWQWLETVLGAAGAQPSQDMPSPQAKSEPAAE